MCEKRDEDEDGQSRRRAKRESSVGWGTNKCDDVERGVRSEGSSRGEGSEHSGEGDREDSGPEEAGGDCPRHSLLSLGEGEDLSRVGEGDGSLSGRVEGGEEEDEEGWKAK